MNDLFLSLSGGSFHSQCSVFSHCNGRANATILSIYSFRDAAAMPFDHSYAQLWTRLFGRVPMKMLMLGITGSGKTSLMYKYKMGD